MQIFCAIIKFLLIVGIFIETLVISVEAGSTYIVNGDVEVVRDESQWKCDRIQCPINTDRCQVQKRISPTEPTQVIRENFCYDANNSVIKKHEQLEPIRPWMSHHIVIDVCRNGYTASYTGKPNVSLDCEEMLQITLRQTNEIAARQMRHMEEQMRNMEENMSRAFRNFFK